MNRCEEVKRKLSLILAMTIFGSIGIFRKYIDLPSQVIALARAVIGVLFLLAVIALRKRRTPKETLKKSLPLLAFSGVFIGFNWILLFEAYCYTTVSAATLCYYMAPIIVILLSPIFLKDKLTVKKGVCALVSFCGMMLVSGIFRTGFESTGEIKGILFGLGAAVLYAFVVLMNKKISGVDAVEKTFVQLFAGAALLLPYTFFTQDLSALHSDWKCTVLLLTVGVIHTGFAYVLYFNSVGSLKAHTVALYSYIDPVIAIILSALILQETMGLTELLGAVMILGSAAFCEKKQEKGLKEKA